MVPGGHRPDGRAWTGLVVMAHTLCWTALAQPLPATAPVTPPAATAASDGPTWLRVTADSLNLRSRPDANSVVVARVERDAVLRSVGRDSHGWYRVEPPAGVFSYVAAEFIDRRGPTEGVVSVRSGGLRVRVGSLVHDLDPWRSEMQVLLDNGAPVRIIGEQGEWLKIEPPAGVQVYVAGEHVVPISAEALDRLRVAGVPAASPSQRTPPARPTTQPAEPDLRGPWGERLVMVEAAIAAEGRRPMAEQSWTDVLARLRPIAEQREEPTVARLAAAWIEQLQQRRAEQEVLRDADEVLRRLARDQAQHEREMERIARARQVTTRPGPEVRGELRRSDALGGHERQRWYKLLDPLTGRVEAFLEVGPETPFDPDPFLGQYVAVRGVRRPAPHLGADVLQPEEIARVQRAETTTQPARQEP